mmetsp:Transcript_8938/g.16383  ORF Transcript_8938/g.16383 Transcript_8938/m.16383 type:complete len:144 (-) Transcript_8938:331-762(-)
MDYRKVVLQQMMDQYENKDGSRATIDQLKEFGITLEQFTHSYSGVQAIVALTVLTRAYAYADVADAVLNPGYLSLILGLILYEEISHVWLNISMFVWGTLLSHFDSDWPRKLVVLMLALTSAMDMEDVSAYQRYCTLGVSAWP